MLWIHFNSFSEWEQYAPETSNSVLRQLLFEVLVVRYTNAEMTDTHSMYDHAECNYLAKRLDVEQFLNRHLPDR